MAARTNKVEVEITASDEATPKIERLERKIDGLEADEARVTVTANTDRLEQQLADAKTRLEGLDGDEASVTARLVGNLEDELEQARRLLAQLDGQTGTVRITAVDTASGDIDRVDAKLRQLDGRVADVRTGGERAGGVSVGGLGKGIGFAAIAAALFESVTTANQLAGEVQQVADATGAPLDKASRLVTVWKQNGFEVSDLLDIIFQINGALAQSPELAGQVGVSLADNQDLIDTFLESVNGVATSFENVADRQVAASTLFGEEGTRQITAVTTAVGDLDAAMSNLPEAQTIDEADVDRWREANAEVTEFQGKLLEIQLLLAENILPLINTMLDGLASWFSGVAGAGAAVAEAGGDVRRFFLNVGGDMNNPNQGLTPVINRNTAGFFGGAPIGPGGGGAFRAGVGQIVTIINPSGTPATTVKAERLYEQRNGPR
jgi:hypothetical protein